MYKKRKLLYAGLCILLVSQHASAQLSLSGQLRTRTEFRNGYGSPLPKGTKPAFFTSTTVKNIPNAKQNADWAYLMVIIKPDFLIK